MDECMDYFIFICTDLEQCHLPTGRHDHTNKPLMHLPLLINAVVMFGYMSFFPVITFALQINMYKYQLL